jgi:hypothetical protein
LVPKYCIPHADGSVVNHHHDRQRVCPIENILNEMKFYLFINGAVEVTSS